MASVQVSSQDLLLFQESLANAINNISLNRISVAQAKALTEEDVKGIDFSNLALNHKGVNWFGVGVKISDRMIRYNERIRSISKCPKIDENMMRNLRNVLYV